MRYDDDDDEGDDEITREIVERIALEWRLHSASATCCPRANPQTSNDEQRRAFVLQQRGLEECKCPPCFVVGHVNELWLDALSLFWDRKSADRTRHSGVRVGCVVQR